MAQIQSEKAELRREIAGLNSEIEKLKGGGDRIVRDLRDEVEALKRQLKGEADRLVRDLEQAKVDCKRAVERASDLDKMLDAEKDKCRKLEVEMNKMTANERERLKDIEAELRDKFRKMEADMRDEQRRNEELTTDLAKAHVKLQDLIKEVEGLRGDLASEKKNAINLVVEAESARNAKVAKENELKEAKSKIDSLSKDLEAMSQKYSEAMDKANVLDRELSAYNQDKDAQVKAIVRLETEANMLRRAEAEAKKSVENLNQEVKRLNQSLKDVEGARAVLEHDNGSLKRQVNEATAREAEKMEAITRLTSEITNLSRLFGDLKQQFDQVNSQADMGRKEAETAFAEHTIIATELTTILDAMRRMRDAACGSARTDEQSGALMELQQSGGSALTVKHVANGPAAIKISIGDTVLKIDGRDVTNMSLKDANALVAGKVGSPLTVTARRVSTGVRYMATVVRPGSKADEDVVRLMENQACESARTIHAELSAMRTELAHLKQHYKTEVCCAFWFLVCVFGLFVLFACFFLVCVHYVCCSRLLHANLIMLMCTHVMYT